MPRRLKVLYVMFGLSGAGGALAGVLSFFGVVALITQPVVYGGADASLAADVVLTVSYLGQAVLYGVAAVLLRRERKTGLRWSLVAIGYNALLMVVYAIVVGVETHPVVGIAGLFGLVVPGLFLLLLTTWASREWFRAISA
ncbi:hypothetical protein ACFXKD_19840 [Nocardiopsis aegyptia]|uniref:hypothetical protein n=1 Tax=Nocardiopsis aegyptia TaxID=220378 RepID=UPI003672FD4C